MMMPLLSLQNHSRIPYSDPDRDSQSHTWLPAHKDDETIGLVNIFAVSKIDVVDCDEASTISSRLEAE
jgi:hypothetical protein